MRKPAVGILVGIKKRNFDSDINILMKLCFAVGADVVFFCKNDIDYESHTINAGVWTKNGIIDEQVKFPHWIDCSSENSEVRRYFRDNANLVDDFNLDKKDIYDVMIKSKFAPTVIPTLHTYNALNIISFAMLWKEVIIKPLVGARGEGINSLMLLACGDYQFTDADGNKKILSHADSILELQSLYNNTTVIAQPRMKFLNKDGQIMDFRINVEKNGEGKWQTIFMIARTSRDKIVSNFSAGGYASLLDVTLQLDYGENADKVRRSLEFIAEELPPFVEEKSNCNMLSLGIDVGIDRDTLQAYVIEVNYVPKLTFPDKSVYLSTRADYFKFLTEQVKNISGAE